MAEKVRYPQIPNTVWWGVRAILNRTPNATLDDQFMAVQLRVQKTAAKAYVTELIAAGLLNEDKRATPLASKWRLDPSYSEAVAEILERNYPEGLRNVAPPNEGDRQKAIHWFQNEGLGEGAAGNKAATYFMIGSPTPNESPVKSTLKAKNKSEDSGSSAVSAKLPKFKVKAGVAPAVKQDKEKESTSSLMPLNVNLQIHISADAGTEQIEAIFSAMRRYLHEQQDT